MKKEIKRKEAEEEVEEVEETEEEETEEEEDETEEEKIDEVAGKIMKKLDLDNIKKKLDAIIEKDSRNSDMAKKIFTSKDVQKNVDELTKEEIIVGFFSALVRNDKAALKALSEGVPADGGYLFPKFIGA
jgi:HK97 family phage major capsid protein